MAEHPTHREALAEWDADAEETIAAAEAANAEARRRLEDPHD